MFRFHPDYSTDIFTLLHNPEEMKNPPVLDAVNPSLSLHTVTKKNAKFVAQR